MINFNMPKNVRIGLDSLQTLPDEINKLKPAKIGLVSDKGLENAGIVKKVEELIDATKTQYTTFTDIQGEPSFTLLEKVIQDLKAAQCDLIVGIGGGSAMDVAKTAAALLDKEDFTAYLSGEQSIEERTVPCILLPTTSGTGAEVTMNAIFSDEKEQLKRGLVSSALLPDAAIVDPLLTVSCPPRVTAASGVDAFTHAIESYVAVRKNPLTKMYAQKAMELFPKHIVHAVKAGEDVKAREGMSWVSNLAGVSLANAGVGAVHAMAYPLGGKYKIEHGVANALLLPYVFEITGKSCPEEMKDIAGFLGLEVKESALDTVIQYLQDLLEELSLPTNLNSLGVAEDTLPELAEQAANVDRLIKNTPYELSKTEILNIYQKAYAGF
jgi:alcohol dehydrogenase class IV